MKYTSVSDIGLVRGENQDYFAIKEREDAFLAVICDGIGGGNAGALASKMTVESLVANFEKQDKFETLKEISSWFGDAITKANFEVYKKSNENSIYHGMGTTMIALVLFGDQGFAFNIGDSRLYLYEKGKLNVLSHDQTYAYEMYRQKKISKSEIDTHPKRNVLMNAVGIDRRVSYEVIEIKAGWDQILLSSDGLHGFVSHDEIKQSLDLSDIEARKNKLMKLSYKKGAHDNISIILIEGGSNE